MKLLNEYMKSLFVLKELYAIGEIDRETYVSNLKEAYTVLRG